MQNLSDSSNDKITLINDSEFVNFIMNVVCEAIECMRNLKL